ncbi:hypothetical protein QCM77_44330 [Bradyrhizobium sp. SSUT18]|uniref:hypothetical protein n=1 Tax=Bradyrhizobium sp. SSUT18 TaxID=3040602 RepID=UPI00244AC338|nr:hypothetical protein [Bradyrhizobium sp. SSUT18]MDH2406811.1 hypothetical protein [Bradyrhizobium sp. SSUT18]
MPIADLLPYAQLGASTAAAIGLLLSSWQFWRSRKATTLQHIQDFLKSMNEREAALADSQDDPAKQRHAFVEYLNFLEVYAAAVNGRLFVGVARELVCEKIVDSLVVLDAAPDWHQQIESSISSGSTYSHIRKFMSRYRHTFDTRKAASLVAGKHQR